MSKANIISDQKTTNSNELGTQTGTVICHTYFFMVLCSNEIEKENKNGKLLKHATTVIQMYSAFNQTLYGQS